MGGGFCGGKVACFDGDRGKVRDTRWMARIIEARRLLERYLKAKLTSEDRPREEARKLLEKVAAAKG